MPFFSSTNDSDEQLAKELSEQMTLLRRQHPELFQSRSLGNPMAAGAFEKSPELLEAMQAAGIEIPEGFGLRMLGNVVLVSPKETMPTAVKIGAGTVGALAGGAALGGAFGSGSNAAAGLGPQLGGGAPGAGTFGAPAASGAASGAGTGAGMASKGIGGAIGKFFGGIDPTTAVLGGLSLLGDDGPQERKSFDGTGRTDARTALAKAFGGTDEMLKLIGDRVKSAKPVILPELPMQLGGGLGVDPSKRMVPPLGVLTGQPQKKNQGY
jgi:hypothetical protein